MLLNSAGRQKCKGKTVALVAQAYCCPPSFYIDHRYRSQRAAGSTKIVARFLFHTTRLAAVSPHLCRRHNSRVSPHCWLPVFPISAAENVCTGRRDLSRVNLSQSRPFDLKAESDMQTCSYHISPVKGALSCHFNSLYLALELHPNTTNIARAYAGRPHSGKLFRKCAAVRLVFLQYQSPVTVFVQHQALKAATHFAHSLSQLYHLVDTMPLEVPQHMYWRCRAHKVATMGAHCLQSFVN